MPACRRQGFSHEIKPAKSLRLVDPGLQPRARSAAEVRFYSRDTVSLTAPNRSFCESAPFVFLTVVAVFIFFNDVIPNRPAVGRVRPARRGGNLLWLLFMMSSCLPCLP